MPKTPTSSPSGSPPATTLAEARRRGYGLLGAGLFFSLFVNLLALTGPIFMMQVYDRVLGSGSEATLAALFGIVAFLFALMGLFDHVRARLVARAGQVLHACLEARVFDAALRRTTGGAGNRASVMALRDLDSISKLYGSPLLPALLDLPWAPVFLIGLYIFHPMLAGLAVLGIIVVAALTLTNQILSRSAGATARDAEARAEMLADATRRDSDAVRALGMAPSLRRRWQDMKAVARDAALSAGDRQGGFGTAARTFRMFLQSAMLALGALLALRGEISAGAMIAGSVMMGRALAPVDQAITQWPSLQQAREASARLSGLLDQTPPPAARNPLPRPKACLEVRTIAAISPTASPGSTPLLRGVSFRVDPGTALGVIGPSGAGKSTLGRLITGIWPLAAGDIHLGGVPLSHYDPDMLGGLIGYLPQRVDLFEGTIAENIARMSLKPDIDAVMAAARTAGAHEMIAALPEGYDTPVAANDTRLSGGQLQRIGLARALYANPVLLVLDEPDANLDEPGSVAMNKAILAAKASGAAVIVIAHRPSAIRACDKLLVIEAGTQKAFGPKEAVLKSQVRNPAQGAPA